MSGQHGQGSDPDLLRANRLRVKRHLGRTCSSNLVAMYGAWIGVDRGGGTCLARHRLVTSINLAMNTEAVMTTIRLIAEGWPRVAFTKAQPVSCARN